MIIMSIIIPWVIGSVFVTIIFYIMIFKVLVKSVKSINNIKFKFILLSLITWLMLLVDQISIEYHCLEKVTSLLVYIVPLVTFFVLFYFLKKS